MCTTHRSKLHLLVVLLFVSCTGGSSTGGTTGDCSLLDGTDLAKTYKECVAAGGEVTPAGDGYAAFCTLRFNGGATGYGQCTKAGGYWYDWYCPCSGWADAGNACFLFYPENACPVTWPPDPEFTGRLYPCNRVCASGGSAGRGGSGGSGGSGGRDGSGGGGGSGGSGGSGGGGGGSGGGSAGRPGNEGTGGNVNIHTCPTTLADPSLFPCYKCDPLPAGSTEGCASIDGNGLEDKPGVRYPEGCDVVFGEYYVPYYPNELRSSHCVYASWDPYW